MSEVAIGPVGHSRFGFSAAHRWLHCTASVTAQEGRPNVSTHEAERGTLMHEVAAALLLAQPLPAGALTLLDEERLIVTSYVMYVLERQLELGATLLVEHPFHLDLLDQELWGTSDAVLLWTIDGVNHAEVIDLKTGRILVRVREYDREINPQLGGYLLGVLMSTPQPISQASITIVQPRREGVVTTPVDLLELEELAGLMVDKIHEAREAPQFVPGSHCIWCLAKDDCGAYQDREHLALKALFDDETLETTGN